VVYINRPTTETETPTPDQSVEARLIRSVITTNAPNLELQVELYGSIYVWHTNAWGQVPHYESYAFSNATMSLTSSWAGVTNMVVTGSDTNTHGLRVEYSGVWVDYGATSWQVTRNDLYERYVVLTQLQWTAPPVAYYGSINTNSHLFVADCDAVQIGVISRPCETSIWRSASGTLYRGGNAIYNPNGFLNYSDGFGTVETPLGVTNFIGYVYIEVESLEHPNPYASEAIVAKDLGTNTTAETIVWRRQWSEDFASVTNWPSDAAFRRPYFLPADTVTSLTTIGTNDYYVAVEWQPLEDAVDFATVACAEPPLFFTELDLAASCGITNAWTGDWEATTIGSQGLYNQSSLPGVESIVLQKWDFQYK